jgi:lysophospholipase L1-like esterase
MSYTIAAGASQVITITRGAKLAIQNIAAVAITLAFEGSMNSGVNYAPISTMEVPANRLKTLSETQGATTLKITNTGTASAVVELNPFDAAAAAAIPNQTTMGFKPSKLSRFYSRLPLIATNGGIDVIGLGDSLFEGTGTSDAAKYAWFRLIFSTMQQWANRKWAPSIKGGLGFISAYASSGVTNTTVVNTGTMISGTPSAANGHTAFATCRIASGANGVVTLTTKWCTDLEIVFKKQTVAATTPYAITGTGSAQAVGATFVSGATGVLLPTWGANVPPWTANSNGVAGSKLPIMVGATASATNTVVAVSAPSADNVHINGFIHYRDDRTAGFRYHDLGRSGWNLYAVSGSSAMLRAGYDTVNLDELNFDNNVTNKQDILANIDQWTYISTTDSTTVGGAGRGALVVFEFLYNDQSNYGNADDATAVLGRTTFQAALQKAVDRAITRPSQPSVLLIIPPAPEGMEARYRIFKEAMYNIENATEHCALIDVDAGLLAGGPRVLPDNWENDTLGVRKHPTTEGAIAWAAMVSGALIAGCPS